MAKRVPKKSGRGKSGSSGEPPTAESAVYSDTEIEEMRREFYAQKLKEELEEQEHNEAIEEARADSDYISQRNSRILWNLARLDPGNEFSILGFAREHMEVPALADDDDEESSLVSRARDAYAVAKFVADTIAINSDESWIRLSDLVRVMTDNWRSIMDRRAAVVQHIDRIRVTPDEDYMNDYGPPWGMDTPPTKEQIWLDRAKRLIGDLRRNCAPAFGKISEEFVASLISSSKPSTLVAAHLSIEADALIKDDAHLPNKEKMIDKVRKDFDMAVVNYRKQRGTYTSKRRAPK